MTEISLFAASAIRRSEELAQEAENERKRKLNEDLAKDQWKAQRDALLASTGHAVQFGVALLTGLMAIHGAAIGAVFAFFSMNAKYIPDGAAIAGSYFAAGLIFALFAAAGSYLTQFLYATAAQSVEFSFVHPYVKPTSKWQQATARTLHFATVAVVLMSIGCLAAGIQSLLKTVPSIIRASAADRAGGIEGECVKKDTKRSLSYPCGTAGSLR